jgi:transcriptional regulator with XRE-family HTH domain
LDGAELRRIRDRLLLTQVALGKILGMAGNTVSRKERGLLRIKRSEALAVMALWRERINQKRGG